MSSQKRFRSLAGLLGFCVLLGCAPSQKREMQPGLPGGAAPASPPAPVTASAAEPEPQTLADAEALLEKARVELYRVATNEPAPTANEEASSAAVPSPREQAAPERRDERAQADAAPRSEAPAPAEGACQSACRAFSSLTRASDAVCRLDVDGGKRCERARRVREEALKRVAACGCVQ